MLIFPHAPSFIFHFYFSTPARKSKTVEISECGIPELPLRDKAQKCKIEMKMGAVCAFRHIFLKWSQNQLKNR